MKDEDKDEIIDCSFKGKLAKDSHCIDGPLLSKHSSKLQIMSCEFEYNSNEAMNKELIADLMRFVIGNYSWAKAILCSPAFLFATYLVLVKLNKKHTSDNHDYEKFYEDDWNQVYESI